VNECKASLPIDHCFHVSHKGKPVIRILSVLRRSPFALHLHIGTEYFVQFLEHRLFFNMYDSK